MTHQYPLEITERGSADDGKVPEDVACHADPLHGDHPVAGQGDAAGRRGVTPHLRPHRLQIVGGHRLWPCAHQLLITVEQHHRLLDGVREFAHHRRHAAGNDRAGDARLRVRRADELVEALCGDVVEHRARDGRERHGQGDLEERQAHLIGGLHQIGRHVVEAEADTESDTRDSHPVQQPDVLEAPGRRGRQTQTGGEKQLPAGEPLVRGRQFRTQCAVDVAVLTSSSPDQPQIEVTLTKQPADSGGQRLHLPSRALMPGQAPGRRAAQTSRLLDKVYRSGGGNGHFVRSATISMRRTLTTITCPPSIPEPPRPPRHTTRVQSDRE